mgnify:FL=1
MINTIPWCLQKGQERCRLRYLRRLERIVVDGRRRRSLFVFVSFRSLEEGVRTRGALVHYLFTVRMSDVLFFDTDEIDYGRI